MTEAETRARIVSIAHEWLGTPYRHDSRIKGVAGDCTFFAKVFEEAGLIPFVPIEPYAPSAHLHRAAKIYMETIERYAVETKDPKPGDIVMYFIGRDWSHGGVIVDWPMIIHGDTEARAIVLARGDQGRLVAAKDRRFMTFIKHGTPIDLAIRQRMTAELVGYVDFTKTLLQASNTETVHSSGTLQVKGRDA